MKQIKQCYCEIHYCYVTYDQTNFMLMLLVTCTNTYPEHRSPNANHRTNKYNLGLHKFSCINDKIIYKHTRWSNLNFYKYMSLRMHILWFIRNEGQWPLPCTIMLSPQSTSIVSLPRHLARMGAWTSANDRYS